MTAAAAKATVYERMARVVADLDFIPKQRSQGVSYEFRSIDALMNHLHGPLAKHGLFLAPRVLDDWRVQQIPGTNNREQTQAVFRVEVEVWAEDGSHVTLGPGLAQSHDYGDKAVYQAQQNAIKYLLLEAFCIPVAEQDMDAREADAVPAPAPPGPARGKQATQPPPTPQEATEDVSGPPGEHPLLMALAKVPESRKEEAHRFLHAAANGVEWEDLPAAKVKALAKQVEAMAAEVAA